MLNQSTPFLPGLAGKVCVITGGSGFLGQTLCRALALQGVKIAIIGIHPEKAEQVAKEVERETKTMCRGFQADVKSRESLEQARDAIEEAMGTPDFLINGAGGNSPQATTRLENFVHSDSGSSTANEGTSFFDLTTEASQAVFDLNYTGTFLACQVFARAMSIRGFGVILNISSMNSIRPLTRIPSYSAAKASVNNFTQWLSVHLAPAGVRVNAIAPGFFLTDQNRFLLTNPESGEITARGKKIMANTPMGRFGLPDDLTGTVLFLLSDLSSFVTGIIIPVDGGFSAYGGV